MGTPLTFGFFCVGLSDHDRPCSNELKTDKGPEE